MCAEFLGHGPVWCCYDVDGTGSCHRTACHTPSVHTQEVVVRTRWCAGAEMRMADIVFEPRPGDDWGLAFGFMRVLKVV